MSNIRAALNHPPFVPHPAADATLRLAMVSLGGNMSKRYQESIIRAIRTRDCPGQLDRRSSDIQRKWIRAKNKNLQFAKFRERDDC